MTRVGGVREETVGREGGGEGGGEKQEEKRERREEGREGRGGGIRAEEG